jgi:hypothetical protein
MKKILAVIVLALGCTDDSGSTNALKSAGYSNIKLTGYSFFSCSDSDTFATGFVATNPVGQRVNGAVCCGWIKNCTIRF